MKVKLDSEVESETVGRIADVRDVGVIGYMSIVCPQNANLTLVTSAQKQRAFCKNLLQWNRNL